MRELPGHVEWKYYSHDLPTDLPSRLVAAGLEPEDEETVVVAEATAIAPPPADVELREETEAFVELAERIFGRSHGSGIPKHSIAVVAYVDGEPVSGGRVDLDPGVEFAGLFGGVTLPDFRGRGLYRATVARRAELAREAGYRWLYVDALPTSRPILERLGFVRLTTTTPYVIPRAAG
jgi:GNAT superfamily N-acetyltransferase